MRILHVYKKALPESMGGVEQVVHQLAQGAAERGMQVTVLALTSSNTPSTRQYGNYVVHQAKGDFEIASTGFSLSVIKQFASLCQYADVVHYHYPWPMMDLLHLLIRPKARSVLTYHSDIVKQRYLLKLYSPLMRWMMRNVDRIIATSPNYLESSETLQRYKEKVHLIPYGLDKESYPKPSEDAVGQWQKLIGPKFFLFVGVLRYYKGLTTLIEAAKGTKYPIVIVGAGPLEQDLRDMVKADSTPNVHFLGQLPDADKTALLNACLAFVFPSNIRSEAFGISLLEAAMFGKPMISCEIGTGTTYINIHGQTGIVIPPNDPMALRRALKSLWDDPISAKEMGAKAARRYASHFSADRMVSDYAEVYRSLIA